MERLIQKVITAAMGTDKFITGWQMVGKTCAVTAYDMKTKSAGSGYCKVYCPYGKRVLGGGFGDVGVTTSLLENGPVFENDWYGWDAWVSSGNMISGDFSVYAICAKVDTTISSTP